jgi:hypothetical protein
VVRVRTDISEKHIDSIISVERFFLILFTMMMAVIHSCETLVLTRATRCHVLEDGIHHRFYQVECMIIYTNFCIWNIYDSNILNLYWHSSYYFNYSLPHCLFFLISACTHSGHRVGFLVEAFCYRPEGCRFDVG